MIAYEADAWGKVVVEFMKFLNYGIYSLINVICKLFMNLAHTSLFTPEMIDEFLGRIYVVVGILMLFRLAFSLLGAIANPDALLDKEKGMQKIITRTMIALVMLIFVPVLFTKAIEWQGDIAVAVPRIILGINSDKTDLSTSDHGEVLAAATLSAFIQQNDECSDSESDKQAVSSVAIESGVATTLDLADQRCLTENKQYMFQFNGFISMIVGIALVFILASYSIDMGIRAIKLGILRMLAPIPIISYIDPKSEKTGAFHNWTKECISTYMELFIKLTILYFVLFILNGIAAGNGLFDTPAGTDSTMQGYIRVFLILAAFFFMGKASKFICNILGLKEPENKGGWMKAITGFGVAGALGAGALSGAATNFRGTLASQKARGVKTNYASAIGSALLGAGTGLWVSGAAAASAQKGKMGAALGAMYKRNTAYAQAAAGGATLFGKFGAGAQRALSGETGYEAMKREYDATKEKADLAKQRNASQKAFYDHLVSEGVKKQSNARISAGPNGVKFGNTTFTQDFTYDQFVNAWQNAKTKGLENFTVGGATFLTHGADTSFADAKMKEHLGNVYYDNMSDPNDKRKVELLAADAGIDLTSDAVGGNYTKSIKDASTAAENESIQYSADMEKLRKQMQQAKANSDGSKRN